MIDVAAAEVVVHDLMVERNGSDFFVQWTLAAAAANATDVFIVWCASRSPQHGCQVFVTLSRSQSWSPACCIVSYYLWILLLCYRTV